MSAATRVLLLVGAGFAALSAVIVAGSWLSVRSSGRALSRWREQHDQAGPVLPAYCPQVDDLYWDGIEAPARWWS